MQKSGYVRHCVGLHHGIVGCHATDPVAVPLFDGLCSPCSGMLAISIVTHISDTVCTAWPKAALACTLHSDHHKHVH